MARARTGPAPHGASCSPTRPCAAPPTLNDRVTLPHVRVLGVRVDVVTEAAFLALVGRWAGDRTPRQIVTINPEFVMRAHDDARFAAVLGAADLAAPDRVGGVLAARRP